MPDPNSAIVQILQNQESAVVAQRALFAASGRGRYCVRDGFPSSDLAALIPDDFVLRMADEAPAVSQQWLEGPRGGMHLQISGGRVTAFVLADAPETARQVRDEMFARCAPADPDYVTVQLHHLSAAAGGIGVDERRLRAEPWQKVRRNYPSSCRERMDVLVSLREPMSTARLILWHGEPGTGKTSAALSLMREWAPWCSASVITDPERMFQDSHYLMGLLAAGAAGRFARSADNGWRVLLCEDADDYLRNDARARSGPALGRLLNASDGLLGRGTRTLILLTTNDEIGRLHPAVTRPGRCLAVVDFPRFTQPEAAQWLRAEAGPPGGATLAELFFRTNSDDLLPLPAQAPHLTGSYL